MEKARGAHQDADPVYFTPGSLSNPALLICLASSTTPFEFPSPSTHATFLPLLMDEVDRPRIPSEGIQRVVGLPQVFGLHGNNSAYAGVNHLVFMATTFDAWTHPSMMDGGANICVKGILGRSLNYTATPDLGRNKVQPAIT
jgi:hypothetical protein